jgi:hypothetical protein
MTRARSPKYAERRALSEAPNFHAEMTKSQESILVGAVDRLLGNLMDGGLTNAKPAAQKRVIKALRDTADKLEGGAA